MRTFGPLSHLFDGNTITASARLYRRQSVRYNSDNPLGNTNVHLHRQRKWIFSFKNSPVLSTDSHNELLHCSRLIVIFDFDARKYCRSLRSVSYVANSIKEYVLTVIEVWRVLGSRDIPLYILSFRNNMSKCGACLIHQSPDIYWREILFILHIRRFTIIYSS